MTLDPPEASLAAALLRSIRQLREQLADVKLLDDTDFDRVRTEWIALGEAMKEAVFTPSPAQQRPDRAGAEDGDGEGVTESIEQAKSHAFAPVVLNAGDIGDRGQMIVVESVAQAKEKTGDKCKLKRGRHAGSKVRFRDAACKGAMDRDAC